MTDSTLADAIIRFEAARALLGHVATASPDEVEAAVESVPSWVDGPTRTAWVLTRIGEVWERRRREAYAVVPVPPVVPALHAPGMREDGAVLTHTTLTGRTRLLVRPSNVVGAEGQWRVTMERDVPIPLHDARRLAVAALVDDIDALTPGVDVDVLPSRPQAAARADWPDRVADAITTLSWLGAAEEVPWWARDVAARALRAYAPLPAPAELGRRAERRLREVLAELAELDGQLDHTPEDTAPEWGRRNGLVREAMLTAAQCGHQVGVRHEGDEGYPLVAYLDLPGGQVSWHLPDGAVPHWWPRYGDCWDGHSRAATV